MKKIIYAFLSLMLLFSSCARHRASPYQERPKKVEAPKEDKKSERELALSDYVPFPEMSDLMIVIDPGHGGKDFGCESFTKPKAVEKHMALSTSVMISRFLKKMGYRTVLTRKEDIFVPLKVRSDFANTHKSTLFVSVHYNSAESRQAQGLEVFYYKGDEANKQRSGKSKLLAKSVLDEVLKQTKGKSRGIKEGNFSVIRETKMPAILIEVGFLTNDDEADRLRDPLYQQRVSYGIAQGIDLFLKERSRRDLNARPAA